MAHPTHETLLRYIENQLPQSEQKLVESHIASPCRRCSNILARLRLVLDVASDDRTKAPPVPVFQKSVDFFRQRPAISFQERVRILAKLIFDNHTQMPQLSMRGASPISTHQMLFSAQQVDIDLQITPDQGKHNLVGQILGSDQTTDPSLAFVCLKSESGEMLEGTETDSLGQFTFRQIPSGIYDLVFDLESQEVAITSLEFRNDE